ncbi:hypothetical protein CES86_5329 [Brucella lupini]|uniref:Uncharacterized protein n=1 Tax=Brucella lupini TaxID=255457 RepID=A0A256H0H9_9HYPH|nr:hypothetical protein CES86_5329 [Brucella lupini]
MLQQQRQPRTRGVLANKPNNQVIHRSAPNRIRAPKESHRHVNANTARNLINLSSLPWAFPYRGFSVL